MDFDAPTTDNDAPPSYDTNFLADVKQAPVDAPPAFDMVESNVMNQVHQHTQDFFPPPPPIDSVMPPPPSMDNLLPEEEPDSMLMFGMTAPSAPAASAPSFEDLLRRRTTTIYARNASSTSITPTTCRIGY